MVCLPDSSGTIENSVQCKFTAPRSGQLQATETLRTVILESVSPYIYNDVASGLRLRISWAWVVTVIGL